MASRTKTVAKKPAVKKQVSGEVKPKYKVGQLAYVFQTELRTPSVYQVKITGSSLHTVGVRNEVGKLVGETKSVHYALEGKPGTPLFVEESQIYPDYTSVAKEFTKNFLHLLK